MAPETQGETINVRKQPQPPEKKSYASIPHAESLKVYWSFVVVVWPMPLAVLTHNTKHVLKRAQTKRRALMIKLKVRVL